MVATGIVQWFNEIHGNGFIDPDEGGGPVRVDYRSIVRSGYRTLHEGQRVYYDLTNNGRGPVAVNVIADE